MTFQARRARRDTGPVGYGAPFSADVRGVPAARVAAVSPAREPVLTPWQSTCAECGKRDAIYPLRVEMDGVKRPACAGCWRRARTFASAQPPQTVVREQARRFDSRVLDAVEKRPGATVIELCVDLELLPEGSERSRENQRVVDRVKDALRRLSALRRVQKRRRNRRARFWAL